MMMTRGPSDYDAQERTARCSSSGSWGGRSKSRGTALP